MTAPRDTASSLRAFCTRYLGRPWTPEDGRPPGAIAEAEQRLGVPLPPELAEFHQHLGGCTELLEAHNDIFPLERLEIEDERLFFAEENQSVVSWAIPLPGDVVWQRVNDGADSWYSEEQGVIQFLQAMLDWTFEVEVEVEAD